MWLGTQTAIIIVTKLQTGYNLGSFLSMTLIQHSDHLWSPHFSEVVRKVTVPRWDSDLNAAQNPSNDATSNNVIQLDLLSSKERCNGIPTKSQHIFLHNNYIMFFTLLQTIIPIVYFFILYITINITLKINIQIIYSEMSLHQIPTYVKMNVLGSDWHIWNL